MDTVHECDRQTDGRTDGRTDRITITNTVQRIALHGKNEGSEASQISDPKCAIHHQITDQQMVVTLNTKKTHIMSAVILCLA